MLIRILSGEYHIPTMQEISLRRVLEIFEQQGVSDLSVLNPHIVLLTTEKKRNNFEILPNGQVTLNSILEILNGEIDDTRN